MKNTFQTLPVQEIIKKEREFNKKVLDYCMFKANLALAINAQNILNEKA